MLGNRTANSDSYEVTTPSEREIRLTRLFDAPRELVFDAMTTPEHVRQWWGCLGEGYSVPVCEIDLRPGGAWRFVNRHPKGEAAFHGEYREITKPSRLVFTEIFEEYPDTVSVMTTDFVDEGNTRKTVTVEYPSRPPRSPSRSGRRRQPGTAAVASRCSAAQGHRHAPSASLGGAGRLAPTHALRQTGCAASKRTAPCPRRSAHRSHVPAPATAPESEPLQDTTPASGRREHRRSAGRGREVPAAC